MFFRKDLRGHLRQLARSASYDLILTADSATLKLDNQKNVGGACVYTKK